MVVRTQKPVNLPVKSVGIHNDSSSIRYPYIYLSNTRPILIKNQTEFIQFKFNSSLPLNLDKDLIAAFNEQLNMNSYPQIT